MNDTIERKAERAQILVMMGKVSLQDDELAQSPAH